MLTGSSRRPKPSNWKFKPHLSAESMSAQERTPEIIPGMASFRATNRSPGSRTISSARIGLPPENALLVGSIALGAAAPGGFGGLILRRAQDKAETKTSGSARR